MKVCKNCGLTLATEQEKCMCGCVDTIDKPSIDVSDNINVEAPHKPNLKKKKTLVILSASLVTAVVALSSVLLIVNHVKLEREINAVVSYIDDIGNITYSDDCYEKIHMADMAYTALNNVQKNKVANYSILETAQDEYLKLKEEAERAEFLSLGRKAEEATENLRIATENYTKVNEMIDTYLALGETISTSDSYDEVQESAFERNIIEDWFIENYPDFCTEYQQQNGKIEDSMKLTQEYVGALKEKYAISLKEIALQIKENMPKYYSEKQQLEKKIADAEAQRDANAKEIVALQKAENALRKNGGIWDDSVDIALDIENNPGLEDFAKQAKDYYTKYDTLDGFSYVE